MAQKKDNPPSSNSENQDTSSKNDIVKEAKKIEKKIQKRKLERK